MSLDFAPSASLDLGGLRLSSGSLPRVSHVATQNVSAGNDDVADEDEDLHILMGAGAAGLGGSSTGLSGPLANAAISAAV